MSKVESNNEYIPSVKGRVKKPSYEKFQNQLDCLQINPSDQILSILDDDIDLYEPK